MLDTLAYKGSWVACVLTRHRKYFLEVAARSNLQEVAHTPFCFLLIHILPESSHHSFDVI